MVDAKSSVKSMVEYDPPLEGRKGKVRLDFNENTVGCSPNVLEALRNVNAEEICCYPEYGSFRRKLSSFLEVSEQEVILTNGADEAIKVIMDTFVEKDDEVLIPVPSFSMFTVYASIADASIINVEYNRNLSFSTDNVLALISSKTKLVILTNPNNPTGTEITEKDILAILKKAGNALVVIDEAYFQYYGKSSKGLISKYDNLVVIQTFSKAFGLAGLRLGCIISNENVTKSIRKAISPYSVNSLALVAASAALEDIEFVDRYVAEVMSSKKILEYELRKLGIKTFPSKANFILADFGDKCNYVYFTLKKQDILVRDRSNYPLLKNCLRIGIGSNGQMQMLIGELKRMLRKESLLFDMDGVLVDVSQSYRIAIKYTVEYFTKQKISDKEIHEMKESGGYNNDWDLTEAIILGKKILIPKAEIIEKFQEFYLGNGKEKGLIDNERWLLPREILKKLYMKYRLGIVTGRPRKEAFYTLKSEGVSEYFDTVVSMDDIPKGKGKPNPCGIRKAMALLGTTDAVYFGDCVDDMVAARNAGIESVGVTPACIDSSRLDALLRNSGARDVIENISSIMGVLK